MIQHFYANNVSSLCCNSDKMESRLSSLTNEDLEEIKKLPSIEKYLEQSKLEDKLLDDDKFKVLFLYSAFMKASLRASNVESVYYRKYWYNC